MLSSFPVTRNEELSNSKINLAFERERQLHEVSVSVRSERRAISDVRPNGPASISWHNFQPASMRGVFSWRGLIQQRALEVHSFSAGMLCRKRRCSFLFQKALSWELAHVGERHKRNVLVWSVILHVVKLRVLVYSSTHLEFCQIRKHFCLLAFFAWRVLYLHYVRYCTRCRSVLTERPLLRLGHFVRTDRQRVHYPCIIMILTFSLLLYSVFFFQTLTSAVKELTFVTQPPHVPTLRGHMSAPATKVTMEMGETVQVSQV